MTCMLAPSGGGRSSEGGMLERKSDPTQERSDPPISVAARVLIERRALITVVGVAASLLPRSFFAGEEKTAWYNLLAHAQHIP